jgi:hypothetical protein
MQLSVEDIPIMRLFLLVALGMLLPAAHAANVYEWVDAQGVEHLSDTPPPADQEGVELLKVNDQDINVFHDDVTESAVAASVPVPSTKTQPDRVPRDDDECAAMYDGPCDWDNQWHAYALANCERVADPNCDDDEHLRAHYDPRVQARRHSARAAHR